MIVTDFDIATDVKVEFLLPDETGNTFILGLSELGSSDVLGGYVAFVLGQSLLGSTDLLGGQSAYIWQATEAVVSNFEMTLGGSIESSIYFQPEPASANIQMQSYDFDPNVNKSIRTNTAIRLRLDNGVVDHTLFTGYIDTISVSYYPDGLNVIQINAYDIYKAIVNTRIATYDTTGYTIGYVTPLEAIQAVLTDTGYLVSGNSVDTDGKIPTVSETDIVANSVINEAIQVGLGIVWVDPETEELVYQPRPTSENGTVTTWTVGNNHGEPFHLCMSDIEVTADADAIFNSLKVTLESDPNVSVSLSDIDSIELYGESATDITLNVYDEADLTRWALDVFSQTPDKLVQMVETPTIDRLGNLTEAALFMPGTLLGVKFSREQLDINEYYTIIKVNHKINVDGWYTQLELWKES